MHRFTTLTRKLTRRDKALDKRKRKLDRRDDRLDDRAAELDAQPVYEAPAREPEPAAPASIYYENCDAVRAAGDAPVRRGDPGYASHLDRDGDGVGCE